MHPTLQIHHEVNGFVITDNELLFTIPNDFQRDLKLYVMANRDLEH